MGYSNAKTSFWRYCTKKLVQTFNSLRDIWEQVNRDAGFQAARFNLCQKREVQIFSRTDRGREFR